MKRAVLLWLAVFMSGMIVFCSTQGVVMALTATQMLEFSQNDILFYDPCTGGSDDDSADSDSCYDLDELTWEDLKGLGENDTLRLVVEHYGEFAMQLQKYYGIPWEFPFAIMVNESGVGTNKNSVSGQVERDGYFNMMGLDHGACGTIDHYRVQNYTYDSNGHPWSGYKTISDMLLGYAIYHVKNNNCRGSDNSSLSSYDTGLSMLSPDNYRLAEAVDALQSHYCDETEGACYDDKIMPIIDGTSSEWSALGEVRKEKGWKTSAELAKAWNIQPGGIAVQKWGWGDIREQIWNEYGATGLPDCSENGGETIAQVAIDLAWHDANHSHDIKPEYAKAAEEVGLESYGKSPSDKSSGAEDCGHFVSVVVRKSGVDKDISGRGDLEKGTDNMMNHLASSDLWVEVENKGNDNNLEPGDILVRSGHIKIWLGNMGGEFNTAEASLLQFTGRLANKAYDEDNDGQTWRIFRAKNGGNTKKKTEGGSSEVVRGANAIVETAKKLSWDEGKRPNPILLSNDTYTNAAKARGGQFITGGNCNLASLRANYPSLEVCPSCARFVSMVFLEANIDSEFTKQSSGGKVHLIGNNSGGLTYYLIHSPKWIEVEDYDGIGYQKLEPGDVLVADSGYRPSHIVRNAPYSDHTFIYLGNGKVAEASNSFAGGFQYSWNDGVGGPNDGYVAFRYIGDGKKSNKVELHKPDNAWLDNAGLDGFQRDEALNSRAPAGKQVDDYVMEPGTDNYKSYASKAGDGAGLPGFIVLHWTAGTGYPGWDGYCGEERESNGKQSVFPPHFTIDVKNRKIWQHFPLSNPSAAVMAGDEIWDLYGVQIEVIGGPESEVGAAWDYNNFTDDEYDYLAKLLIEISNETGIPLTSSLTWIESSQINQALSTEEIKKYIGVLGHEHLQGQNGKWDPGKMWEYIKPALERLGYVYQGGGGDDNSSCGESSDDKGTGVRGTCYKNQMPGDNDGDCTSDGYTWYYQFGKTWGSHPLPSCGENIDYCGCGPTSLAAIITNLTGKFVTPIEVADKIEAMGAMTGVGTDTGSAVSLVNEYGLKYETVSFSDIDRLLGEGKMIWTSFNSTPVSWEGGSGSIAGTNHVIAIRGKTSDGKWQTLDSAGVFGINNERKYIPSTMAGAYNGGGVFAIYK
ncbi:N-acetylmuramoyl-L-alanine amidase [Candidatus Saccharibacteria bacterium]|nr:N-acetylmuramoyl-L-alanine amidase [Candidatus Saccharibacteria bacterium]